MEVTAKQAKDRLGEMIATSAHEEVMITRYGRPEAVLISAKRFEELELMEDRYWAQLARQGEASGYMGVEESEAFIKRLLSAED